MRAPLTDLVVSPRHWQRAGARMNTATEPQQSVADWLRQALIAGAVESAHIKVLAEQAGIGPKALRNGRERLGVVATRHGQGLTMRSVWTLPVEIPPEPGSDGLEVFRAPGPSAASLSTIVKVESLRKPVVSADAIPPEKAGFVAIGEGGERTDQRDAECSEMLRIAKVQTASANAGLTDAEAANLERRVHQFVDRGMNAAHGRELAIRLVVERDRAGSKAGSCIECQCLDRSACEPGTQGHTPGPRDLAEIWMCWAARRA